MAEKELVPASCLLTSTLLLHTRAYHIPWEREKRINRDVEECWPTAGVLRREEPKSLSQTVLAGHAQTLHHDWKSRVHREALASPQWEQSTSSQSLRGPQKKRDLEWDHLQTTLKRDSTAAQHQSNFRKNRKWSG